MPCHCSTLYSRGPRSLSKSYQMDRWAGGERLQSGGCGRVFTEAGKHTLVPLLFPLPSQASFCSPSHSFFPLLCVPPQFESQTASSLEGVIISQGCGLSLPLAVWGHLGSSQGKSSDSWHNLCTLELQRPRAVTAASDSSDQARISTGCCCRCCCRSCCRCRCWLRREGGAAATRRLRMCLH